MTTDQRGALVLSARECDELLWATAGKVGRIGFSVGNHTTILPVNFVLYLDDILFRLGPGSAFDAISRSPSIAFEIDGLAGAHRESPEAWSVLVHGKPRVLREPEELADVTALGLTPLVPDAGEVYVAMTKDTLSGRRFTVGALARYRLSGPVGSSPRA